MIFPVCYIQNNSAMEANMHSKKKLFAHLAQLNIAGFEDIVAKGLKHPRIGDETYGKKSCIYIRFANLLERRRVERELSRLGHKVDAGYCIGDARTEVQVSYFKGWHWDE